MVKSSAQRLAAATVALAHADQRPTYDRTSAPQIAHLGFGAFARAHLGVYADDLLRQGRLGMIRGVSIRSPRAEDQLTPQDGLYTVAEREPGAEVSLRVVGSLASMQTGPAAALDAIAAPTTMLVTMTITEKGYEASPDEPEPSGAPASAPMLIALALAHRRRAGLSPPVFASLDNLLENGRILRIRVLEAARRFDPSLAEWIASEVAFPSSVVDRMVPAPTVQDQEDIGFRLGLIDRSAVSTERHRSWTIGAIDALAPLAGVGVELVEDVTPFERRKLWLLNGPHSAVAYSGLLAGCGTIAQAVGHAPLVPFVRRVVDETLEVAELPAALEPERFADEALRRFANPMLGHTCAQVGADGSSKLPQRLLPVAAARRAHGLGTHSFAVVAAIWIAATAGLKVRGADLPALEDPAATHLRAAASRGASLRRLSNLALGSRADDAFVVDVAGALERLVGAGLAVLEAPR
jgi:fructuronate reductase